MNPIRKSLVTPPLLGGMERVPLVVLLFVAGVFVLFQTPASVLSGLLLAGAGVVILRRIAEADPQYFQVLYRRLKYHRYHGAVPLDAARPEYKFWHM